VNRPLGLLPWVLDEPNSLVFGSSGQLAVRWLC
jgi:hypothetical protein